MKNQNSIKKIVFFTFFILVCCCFSFSVYAESIDVAENQKKSTEYNFEIDTPAYYIVDIAMNGNYTFFETSLNYYKGDCPEIEIVNSIDYLNSSYNSKNPVEGEITYSWDLYTSDFESVTHGNDKIIDLSKLQIGNYKLYVSVTNKVLFETGETKKVYSDFSTKYNTQYLDISVKDGFAVTVKSDKNGTVTVSKTVAGEGDNIYLSAVANDGFHFVEWQGNLVVDGESFTMPSHDVEITAVFENHEYSKKYDENYHWNECSFCHVVSDKNLHERGELSDYKVSSCFENGYEKYKCSQCDKIITVEKDLLQHTVIEDKEILPTCTNWGVTKGSHCSVCNIIITEQKSIPPLEHSLVVNDRKEPTCTKDGYTSSVFCEVCNKILIEQTVIPAKGHIEQILSSVEATCSKTGYSEGKECSVCDEVITSQTEIEKLKHTEVIIPEVLPTCLNAGKTQGKYCRICGLITEKQEDIPANGHSLIVDEEREATCETNGLTLGVHCENCNEIILEQNVISSLGHSQSIIFGFDSTCSTVGLTDKIICSRCNKVLVHQKEIPKKQHNIITDEYTAPSCTQVGYTSGTHCSICNEILTSPETIPTIAHIDENFDNLCDSCFVEIIYNEECEHICHENYPFNFIWKIINFFNKLFVINRVCECGVYHW